MRFLHSRWATLLLALFSGSLLVAAFAPLAWWPLVFVSTGILLFLWQDASPKRAFWTGYAFGLGLFGVGASWVYNSIHVFGQAPVWVAALLTVLFVAVLALFPALTGWVQARFFRVNRWQQLVLVVPSLWVLFEWLRGWIFTGFPWLYLGNTQLETPLKNIVPVTGVLGASWLVMLLAGLIVLTLTTEKKLRLRSLAAIILVLGGSWLLGAIEWTEPAGRTLRVTLIQGNIAQENKWKPAWKIPTMQRYRDMTIAHWDSDLIVWPEVALPGYYKHFREGFLDPLAREAYKNKTDILLGALFHENGKAYNSIIKIGNGFGVYKKRHLVAFGEYIPLRQFLGWLDGLIVLPASDMNKADEPVVLQAAGEKFSSSICYEDAYGNEMADMLPEATLLLNISNDAWFGDSLAPHQHLEIARMRSLELGRDLLRANNTGITAIVDYQGKVKQAAPQFEVTALTGTVQPRTGSTPFVVWENGAIVLLMLLVSGLAFVLENRGSRNAMRATTGAVGNRAGTADE